MKTNTILQGDALTVLRTLPDEAVHCVVTSPPYWGLRDYGVESQLGLERTPEEYVTRMVETLGEVRRVLRGDGTLWLNMGDCYAGSWGAQGRNGSMADRSVVQARSIAAHPQTKSLTGSLDRTPGLKPKDLVMMPARVAMALQADGWYLRCDIIWNKKNPMPESVTDRPTKAHEYVFLMSKKARYYYDAEAIREQGEGYGRSERFRGDKYENNAAFDNSRDWNGESKGGGKSLFDNSGRNKRTVWTVATKPYKEAHFATFPPDLIKPCILAGTSPKVCAECGAPWVRIIDVSYDNPGNRSTNGPRSTERKHLDHGTAGYDQRLERRSTTTGWQPTCDHDAPTTEAIVLDPFLGSGTTAAVAKELGRSWLGIELNPEYVKLALERIENQHPALLPA